MELKLNGITMQQSSTSAMVFTIENILVHLTQFMTLKAGDIVSTGTPTGTGFWRSPQQFLKPGDLTECTIDDLGTLINRYD